jgi:hypothetical protein
MRGSLPMIIFAPWCFVRRTYAAAEPSLNANSALSSVFATPLTPSVPNSLPTRSSPYSSIYLKLIAI